MRGDRAGGVVVAWWRQSVGQRSPRPDYVGTRDEGCAGGGAPRPPTVTNVGEGLVPSLGVGVGLPLAESTREALGAAPPDPRAPGGM